MSIKINNLTHKYSEGTPFEFKALDDISLEIEDGIFVGLIGHTGSGKSTFIQHLNGLLKPSTGEIIVDGEVLHKQGVSMTNIRRKVGLVFQYPEYQLFEETCGKDIAFGPSNLGLTKEEIEERVKHSLELVGLSYENYRDKSPFEISGGQKRRIAIAGVLAMKPDILILDEPTAGLDPKGKKEILDNIYEIHKKEKNTIILVSHSMEDVSKYADKLLVMNQGKVEFYDRPENVFKNQAILREIGLDIPVPLKLIESLKEKDFVIDETIITIDDLSKYLIKYFGGNINA